MQGAEETERRAKDRAVKAAAAEVAADKRKATQARVERMKEWEEEEIRMLEKALEKFPQVGLVCISMFWCTTMCLRLRPTDSASWTDM